MAPGVYLYETHLHWRLGLVAYMQFVLYDRGIRCIGFLHDGLPVRVVLVVATNIRAAGAFVALIRGAAAALRGSPTAGIVEGVGGVGGPLGRTICRGVKRARIRGIVEGGIGKPLGRGSVDRSRDGVERHVVVVAGGRDVDRPLRRGVVARRGVVVGDERHLGPGSGGSDGQDAAGCQNRRSQAEAHGAPPFRLKPRYLNRCKCEPLPLAMSGRGDHLTLCTLMYYSRKSSGFHHALIISSQIVENINQASAAPQLPLD